MSHSFTNLLPGLSLLLVGGVMSAFTDNAEASPPQSIQVTVDVQPFAEVTIGSKIIDSEDPVTAFEGSFDVTVFTNYSMQLSTTMSGSLSSGTDVEHSLDDDGPLSAGIHNLKLSLSITTDSARRYVLEASGEDDQVLITEDDDLNQILTISVGPTNE